jgi:hypothetical protein
VSIDLQFEWDGDKAARNHRKHGVAFEESTTIFNDLGFITVVDDEHSLDEDRYISIGMSNLGRLLMVAHTDRGGRIRIISARDATKQEERFYAESTES